MYRKKAVLFIWGTGGHEAQMHRFLNKFEKPKDHIFIGMSDSKKKRKEIDHLIHVPLVRDKFHSAGSFILPIIGFFKSIESCIKLIFSYKVVAVISTGPGIAIVPFILFRLLQAKTIYFESWSRVNTRSVSGRICYTFSGMFFVQHKSMLNKYKNAFYAGRL